MRYFGRCCVIAGRKPVANILLCKPKYGSIRSRAPDSCCIPSVPLRIARAPLNTTFGYGVHWRRKRLFSYGFEFVAGLLDENEKLERTMTKKNNDFIGRLLYKQQFCMCC